MAFFYKGGFMKITIRKQLQDSLEELLINQGHEVYLEGNEDSYDSEMFIGFASYDLHKGNYPNLKIIQLMSAGYDGLDYERIKEENITLLNARGVYSEGIAEYVLAQVLYAAQDIDTMLQNQKNKVWNQGNISSMSLINKNVFLLGTGSINTEVAKRLKPFRTNNIGFNSDGRDIEHYDKCYPLSEMKSMLEKADVIIASLPDNKHTKHLFDKEAFDLISKDTIFVNVGRGALLDEASIKGHTKHFRKIILDVFEEEPLDKDSYLWNEDNVVVTPHVSFISSHNEQNRIDLILENLNNLKTNQPLKNQIL